MKIWKMTITIKDDKKKKSKMILWYPYNYSGGDTEPPFPYDIGVVGVAEFILPALDSIIKGQIVGCSISLEIDLPAGLKAIPDADSDVEEGAMFRYFTANRQAYYEQRIPTYKDEYFDENGKLSSEHPPYFASVSLWTSYVLQPEDTAIEPYPGAQTSHGINLQNNWIAWESFIKSGRRKR